MRELLTTWATNRNVEIACGPVSVIDAVRDDIESRRRVGELEANFDRERMSWFRYPDGMPFPDARSVILIALSRPAHTVAFTLEDGPFSAVVPPTYVAYGKTREAVRRDLAANVFQGRYRIEVLPAPLKAVAALEAPLKDVAELKAPLVAVAAIVRPGTYVPIFGTLGLVLFLAIWGGVKLGRR